MPKKILLIENDSALSSRLTEALEGSGFGVRVTGDGKEGLDLAREWGPDAAVLCVELPGMSGYLVCQKLKKDDALKGIPLVLTSAEATPETFEKHRTLKARADEYLLKPYEPEALLQVLGALVGLPEDPAAPAAGEGEEELVSLEEEMGLEGFSAEPEADLPALDLQSLPDDAPAATASADEDLRLLDDAFDGLAARPEPRPRADAPLELELGDVPADGLELDAPAADLAPEGAAASAPGLDDEADAALGALGGSEPLGGLGDDEPLGLGLDEVATPEPVDERPGSRPTLRGASPDLLRAAGIRLLDDAAAPPPTAPPAIVAPPPPAVFAPPPPAAVAPPPPPRAAREDAVAAAAGAASIARLERELAQAQQALAEARGLATGRDGELRTLRERADAAARRAEDAESASADKDVELASLRARLDALTAQARRGDADLKAAREETRRAADRAKATEDELAELGRRATELERRADEAQARAEDAEGEARARADELALATEGVGKAEALERELDELRTELVVARGEADGARGEVENRTAELKKRVQDLEAANAKNEERVLKAYQKIKNDEKVKDKVRKAIAIAGQLLEEGLPAEAPSAEKPRPSPAAALLGRE